MSKKNLDEAAKRLMEEQLYSAVADEIKNNVIREGLMAKALVEASGNEDQARRLYMQYRIQSMLDEAAIKEGEELAKAERREQVKQKRRLEVEWERQQEEKVIWSENAICLVVILGIIGLVVLFS